MDLLIPDSFLYINFSVNTVTAMFVVLMSANADAWIHRENNFNKKMLFSVSLSGSLLTGNLQRQRSL